MNPVAEIPGLLPLWQKVSGGDPAIRIAIIDGPVDLSHPALSKEGGAHVTLGERDAAAASPAIRSEHGTHVTSVLMGVSGSPVLGVAPNCTASVFPIYREGADGELEPSSQATLALAINQALADGADLINISSGQQTPTGQADRILVDAVRRCANAGKLIVAAAGNDGCRCVQVPGALDSVLAVGACDLAGRPLPFSNFGDSYLENGILAPGANVNGASPVHHVALRSGTSFATPIVTGVVALLLSYLRQLGRDADARAVRAALLDSAVPCDFTSAARESRCLVGRLDVPGATAALLGGEQAATDGLSPSQVNAGGLRSPPLRKEVARSATERLRTREGTMTYTPTPAALSASPILGPDGSPLKSASGLAPAAVPSVPLTTDASGPGPAPVAAATSPQAAASPTPAVPPVGAGVVWVPMPMSAAGSLPPAWAPVQPQSMVANTVPPPAVLPATAPPGAAIAEAAPAVRTRGGNCDCGVRPAQAGARPQLCFPIGQLFYDFGKEARLDYFVQAIATWRDSLEGRGDAVFGPQRDRAGDVAAPYNPAVMVRYLLNLAEGEKERPANAGNNFPDANAIIWTLMIDAIPVYAIKPLDVFGLGFYASLLLALWLQEVSPLPPDLTPSPTDTGGGSGTPDADFPPKGSVTRVSLAGWVDSMDTTRLLNGTVVPTLVTDWRGFYQWDLYVLLGRDPTTWPAGAEGFLERIYNEFRNAGISPQDRALNYSAMNAYNTRKIFAELAATGLDMRLDTVEVDRSVICRPDSECFDVTYRFFNPIKVLTQARKVYQYTIDVSDVVPVSVGKLRQWEVY